MEITCPECNFSRTVEAARVPDRPTRVTCPKCRREFIFAKGTQSPPPAEQVVCPACGLNQAAGESCAGCGVVYTKFQARQAIHNASPSPDNGLSPSELADLRPQATTQGEQNLPKAGFWIRVVAYLLDATLLGVVQLILSLMLGLVVGAIGGGGDIALSVVLWLFGATLSIAYAVFFTGYCGQTPGKMALRLKVIRADGSPLTYGRAALREVPGKFLSSILLGIGYLMVAFDNRKQGLHDRIADSYVIKL